MASPAISTPSIKRKVTPSTEPSPSRRVLLPFDIRDMNIDIQSKDVREILCSIFPRNRNVAESWYRSHLIFQMERLPPAPWPVTIGGLPYTLVSDDNKGRALMFPRQIFGHPRIQICQEGYDVAAAMTERELCCLGKEVHSWFETNLPEVCMLELMVTAERTVYVVLCDDTDIPTLRHLLPGEIARSFVGYLNDRELHRPAWANSPAKQQLIQPHLKDEGIGDNTTFDVLRPGVQICSKIPRKHTCNPAVFSTTSGGVLVEDKDGNQFMTGASHGIANDGNGWEGGNPSNQTLGRAVIEIPFTDISLLQLAKSDIGSGNAAFAGPSTNLSRLATSEDRMLSEECFFNSPDTGIMEASIVATSVKVEGSKPHCSYVVYNWIYAEQADDNEEYICPPDGTSGAPIWNSNGVVRGFYHFHIGKGKWSGFSVSVSASEVAERGYSLV